MSESNAINHSNYFINVDGVNNRRKLFNFHNQENTSTTNVLQRRGSEGIDINSFSNDFNLFENILSNQSLKNKDDSERQDKAQNSRLDLVQDEQMAKNLDQVSIENLKKHTRMNEIARMKSKKEINYEDIQQLIQSNQKKGNQYLSQKVKSINSNQQLMLSQGDNKPFSIGKGVTAEYYQYENNQCDEVVNTLKNEEGMEGIKLKNQIIIFSYLIQFVKALLVRYMYKESKMLSVLQYRIIGDNAIFIEKNQKKIIEEIQSIKHRNIFERISFIREMNFSSSNIQQYNKKNKFFKQCLLNVTLPLSKIVNKITQKIIIFKPNNPFILLWETIFLFVILFCLLVIPLEWGFSLSPKYIQLLRIVNFLQVGIFSFDIIIGFHTGFYEFGDIVLSRSRVFKKYLQEKFKSSILSMALVVMNLIFNLNFLNFVALLIMINSISEKMERINLNLQLYQKLSSYLELGKLFLLIVLSVHIFGCGFHYIGNYSEQIGISDNWIRLANLIGTSNGERYVNSIYFAMISMVTIGYGEIHPVNVYEKIYVLGMAFISCGLFAFSVNMIGTIITDIKKKTKEFQNKQYLISCYMSDRQVQKSTQMRVLKYLEFVEDFQDQNISEGAKILELCSQEIKEELLKEYFGRILKNSKLFKGTFSKEFLTLLSLHMRERRFAPGEILIQKGFIMKQLFFITKGQTEYFISNNENVVNICDYGEKMIDLKCFITQQPSEISVRSKGITTAAYIDHSEWQDLIKQFQSDNEKACCLRDQFLFDKRYQYPCKSCGQYQHNIFDCPQVCFKVNKAFVFTKLNHNTAQERKSFHRRDKLKKMSSTSSNEIIRQGLKLLRWQLVKDIFEDYEETDVHQECVMIEKDREFFLRCPKIKLTYFQKRNKQLFMKQHNNSFIKLNGKPINKQRSDSNYYFSHQQVSSSSSSSSNITSSDSDGSSASSNEQEYKQQYIQQQYEQYQNNNLSNSICNILSNNNVNQVNNLQIDSKFDSQDPHTDTTNYSQQIQRKISSEMVHHQQNHIHPRPSKTISKTPKNSRLDNLEIQSQNINSPFPLQSLNPSFFYEQNSQKFGCEDNLNPQSNQQNYPQQQFTIAERIIQSHQRRSILSNKSQIPIPPSYQNYSPSTDNQNPLTLRFYQEKSKSLQESDDPQFQTPSQINGQNNEQSPQEQSGSQLISLNQVINHIQSQIEILYFNISGFQQHQNQLLPLQNAYQQNKKKRKANQTRFKIASNLNSNEKQNQPENIIKENNRQISITSSQNNQIPKDNQIKNHLIGDQNFNEQERFHIFGKFEFTFDKAREFQYYHPKFNQLNIIKAYKKYQSMIVNSSKESMTKKATSASKAMHHSTRKKFIKKQSFAPLRQKNLITFIN